MMDTIGVWVLGLLLVAAVLNLIFPPDSSQGPC